MAAATAPPRSRTIWHLFVGVATTATEQHCGSQEEEEDEEQGQEQEQEIPEINKQPPQRACSTSPKKPASGKLELQVPARSGGEPTVSSAAAAGR
jgi:hypothetical protein